MMSSTNKFQDSVMGMQNHLLAFAMKLTMDRESARDLVQETTLKALNNQNKFVDNANFKGWMLTIMRNIFINNYRQTMRKSTVVDMSDDLYLINTARDFSDQGPEGVYGAREIADIISTLPEDFSKPFSMHVAGFKYEEISKILKMPLGTVKSHIFFSRKRLREILKDYR